MEPKEAKETVADIVKDIRLYVDDCNNGMAYRAFPLDELTDRIESAWKREAKAIATENAVLPAVCITKSVGNAAAMREALYMMRRISDEMNGETFGKGDEEIVKGWANTLRYYSDKALSAPPRNCDVGTEEEQIYLHREWCNRDNDSSYCCNDCRDCFARWAQMPYESEVKGEHK